MTTLEFDPNTIRWGACPDFGPSDPADDRDWQETITKYPDSTSMRIFTPDNTGPGTGTQVDALTTLPMNFWSNKPGNTSAGMSGVKDSYVVPTITLPSGCDEVIYAPWHEVDGKVASDGMVLADFHDLLDNVLGQDLGTGVTTAVVVTAWGIAPSGGNRPWANYYHDGIDYFCADFDGLDPAATVGGGYPVTIWLDTLEELDEVRTAHPGVTICVPEFGAPCADGRDNGGETMPTWDPTGEYRADWMLEWAERFRDFGMDNVELFDFTNGMEVTYTPEIDAWNEITTAPSARNLVVF